MRIWIVNYYTGTPDTVSNPRYVQFAKHFMAKGWEVTTFNANHLDMDKPLFDRKQYGDYNFVHVKAPQYVGNGLKRMFSIFTFAWRLWRHSEEFAPPNVILHNIHAPFDYPIVWAAKKLKAKYITEAWDLWPDFFVQFGLISAHNPVLRLAYQVEKQYYYHADQMVFTFLGSKDYLKNKGWTTNTGGKIDMSRVHYINNGVDLEQFERDREAHPRTDEDINRKDCFKIIYLGSINYANHVMSFIKAAEVLKADKNYQFFVYGDGVHRDALEKYAEEHRLTNVHFKERRIPLCEVAWVVSQATVNVMCYDRPSYIGTSSGKLFQYLAAGKPIVCNVNIAYDNVIEDNNLGIARNLNSTENFVMSIRNLAEQPRANYDGMCERVRKAAERFDYRNLAAEEIKVVEAALAS